jgi:tetratricopeptide (TPR) repeat protein
LTHIDENGIDTPPVLLKNFIIPERAVNIPEFVNIDPDAKRVVEERFIDDYSYLKRGVSPEIFGRTEAAQQQYLESLRLNPDNSESRLALGLSLVSQGKLNEAEEAFRGIPEGDPRYNRALYCLGGLDLDRGNNAAAVQAFRRTLAIGDDDPFFESQVHFQMARALFNLGDFDSSTLELQTALRLDPENEHAIIQLGNIAIRKGDLESAIRESERALELNPNLEGMPEKILELKARAGR